MTMFKEHDVVVLTDDISGDECELKMGDVGTIIHVHPGDEAFVVEFTNVRGDTLDIATVMGFQMRPISRGDVAHARMAEIPTG